MRLSNLFSYMLATIGVVIINGVGKSGAAAGGANAGIEKSDATSIKANIVGNIESSKSNISKLSN